MARRVEPPKTTKVLSLLQEARLAFGGEIFDDYFRDGYRELPEKCMKFLENELRRVVKVLKELGEYKEARKIEIALEVGYLEGWKTYFELNPTHGEYAGHVCGCLLNLGKEDEVEELLKLIKKANTGKFIWDT
jgi:hypothetical protein